MPQSLPQSTLSGDHLQVALAMSALAVAVVNVLQALAPDEDLLAVLQSKAVVELSRLRRTPDASVAVALFSFVEQSLRNPDVLEQPPDD